jgi:hypothetical protein
MHTILENIEVDYEKNRTDRISGASAGYATIKRITQPFAERYALKIWPDESLHVNSRFEDIRGQSVKDLITTKLKARWTFEAAQGAASTTGLSAADIEEEITALLYEFLANEIIVIRDQLLSEGKIMCPYLPISSSSVIIDPETFEPVVAFTTKYAVINA